MGFFSWFQASFSCTYYLNHCVCVFQLSVEGFAVDKMAGEVKVRKILLTFHFSIY